MVPLVEMVLQALAEQVVQMEHLALVVVQVLAVAQAPAVVLDHLDQVEEMV